MDPIISSWKCRTGETRTIPADITPELAATILEKHRFPGQRVPSAANWKLHAEAMRRDHWLPDSQIDVCTCGRDVMLLNGQHRLRAQIDSGTTVRYSVRCHGAKTPADAAAIYASLDVTLMKRGVGTVVNAAREALPGEYPASLRDAIYRALVWMRGESGVIMLSDMAQEWETYGPAMDSIASVLASRNRIGGEWTVCSRLRGTGFVAVMLESYLTSTDPGATDAFWQAVVEGAGRSTNALALRDFIMQAAYRVDRTKSTRPRGGLTIIDYCASVACRCYQRDIAGEPRLGSVKAGSAQIGRISVIWRLPKAAA